jgi:tetratricopeptide (TPR) repeat protein
MKSETRDFRGDIQQLLASFINQEDLSDFIKKLINGVDKSKKSMDVVNKFYADQLKIEYNFAKDRIEIDRAITFAKKNLDNEKYLELLRKLGQLCIGHGKLNLAYEVLTKSIKESSNTNHKAEGLLLLCDVHSRRAEWKRSISALEEAKELFEKNNNNLGTSKCENLLGVLFGERGQLENAKLHFENCLLLLNPESEKELAASVESNLGIIENIQQNYPQALEYFKRSLRKFEILGNYRRIAEIRQNIGLMHFTQKNYTEAIEELDQSIEIALKEGFMPVLGLSYLGKANVLVELEDFGSASQFADKAMEVSHQIDDKLTIADIYRIKSAIERKLQNYTLAESYLQSSLRLNEKMKNVLNIAETYYDLATLYGELDRIDERQECLREALKGYREVQVSEQVQKIEGLLAQAIE